MNQATDMAIGDDGATGNANGHCIALFNTIAIDELQGFAEANANLREITDAVFAIVQAMDRGVLTQRLDYGIIDGCHRVIRIGMDVGGVQDPRHDILLPPGESLLEVLEFIIQFFDKHGAGSVLLPLVFPQPFC